MKEYKFKLKVKKHAIYIVLFSYFSIFYTYDTNIFQIWIIGAIIVFSMSLIYLLKDGIYFKIFKNTGSSFIEIKGEYDIIDYIRFKRINRPKV